MIQSRSHAQVFTKVRILLPFVPFVLLLVLHIFILLVIVPYESGLLHIQIASRAGESTYFLDATEFMAVSYIAMGVAGIIGMLVTLMHRAKKLVASTIWFAILCVLCSAYVSIFLQNAFQALWGGWGSLLGIMIPLLIFTVLLGLVVSSKEYDFKNKK